MKIKYSQQRNFKIQYSGRSSDYLSPSYIMGCGYKCQSYCYVQRKNLKNVYIFENIDDIFNAIKIHSLSNPKLKPNQCGKLLSYDICCDSDLGVYGDFIDMQKIQDFFKENNLMSTFATKKVNKNLLKLKVNPENHRIRFSLMPQNISDKLESGSEKIIDRIKAVDMFIENGWSTHINFSPVVMYKGWEKDYEELFRQVDKHVINKDLIKSEVIF